MQLKDIFQMKQFCNIWHALSSLDKDKWNEILVTRIEIKKQAEVKWNPTLIRRNGKKM
jgi:hypothetical protein